MKLHLSKLKPETCRMERELSQDAVKSPASTVSSGGGSLPTSPARRVISRNAHYSPGTPTRQLLRKQAQRFPATLPPSKPYLPHMDRLRISLDERHLFPRHWFIAFAKELCPADPKSLRLVDAPDEILGISASRRAAIEKVGQTHRSNFIILEETSGQKYFVKRTLNRDRAKREWVCIFPS